MFTVPFSVSYEVDLFGAVRRNVEAANANLQSTAADLQNVQLVLTAELAADYFTLRELDAELQVVEESVGYQRKGLELVNNRHREGIASGLEVAQQAALLDGTLSQVALVKQSRAQYEHAIAVLLGQPAPNLNVADAPLRATPPPLPLGVPSDVLERRPDIATAERRIAYANAQVGIAHAAFYPRITLGGSGGWQSRDITTLANAPSLFWSLGADALQPIFQGGRNRANLAAARSAYDASVADYRQSVLTAFQQVEDGISNLQTLSQAESTQAAAVEEARRELAIANNRYVAGVATYLDVITAQSTLLPANGWQPSYSASRWSARFIWSRRWAADGRQAIWISSRCIPRRFRSCSPKPRAGIREQAQRLRRGFIAPPMVSSRVCRFSGFCSTAGSRISGRSSSNL